jgi:hypothetical protein
MSALGQRTLWLHFDVRFTPQKLTCAVQLGMSALCQKQTHAVQQTIASLDDLVGALLELQGHLKSERLSSLEIDY